MTRPGFAPALARLAAAVAAVDAAVTRRAPDDDDEDDVAAPGVRHITAEPATLGKLGGRFPLTPVYAAFLGAHSSHDHVDTGLRCGAGAAWLVPVTGVAEQTELAARTPGWRPDWLVCAIDHAGWFFLDLGARAGDDCPVRYLAHGAHAPRAVAPGFVAFLEQVARDSAPPVPKDRPLRRPGGPRPAAPTPEAPSAAAPEGPSIALPLLLAVAAAVVLYLLR